MSSYVSEHDEAVRSILSVRTANTCITDAAATGPARKLMGSFWQQNELAVLFADSGAGKSLLAVQVADALSRGLSVSGAEPEIAAQKVVFVDFEMNDAQFERRYTNADGLPYEFHPNFIRVVLKPEYGTNYRAWPFFEALEKLMLAEEATILVFDSLTAHTSVCTSYPGMEQALASRLRAIQQRNKLSVLLTVQIQRLATDRRLTIGSLGSSRYLTSLADSIFAMGHSSGDADGRYVLHLKNKSGTIVYHRNSVLECRISNAGNFPHFEFSGTGRERTHLQGQLCELDAAILAMKRKDPDSSSNYIAKKLGTNRMRVKRVLERHWVED